MITAEQRRHIAGFYVFSPGSEIEPQAAAKAAVKCGLRVTRNPEIKAAAKAGVSLQLYSPAVIEPQVAVKAAESLAVEVTRALAVKAAAKCAVSLNLSLNDAKLVAPKAAAKAAVSLSLEVGRNLEIKAAAKAAVQPGVQVTRRLKICAAAKAATSALAIGALGDFEAGVEDVWTIPGGNRVWKIPG